MRSYGDQCTGRALKSNRASASDDVAGHSSPGVKRVTFGRHAHRAIAVFAASPNAIERNAPFSAVTSVPPAPARSARISLGETCDSSVDNAVLDGSSYGRKGWAVRCAGK